jgi:hypothetical protein
MNKITFHNYTGWYKKLIIASHPIQYRRFKQTEAAMRKELKRDLPVQEFLCLESVVHDMNELMRKLNKISRKHGVVKVEDK